ncbi:MAG: thioesterase family protein [Oceanospirillaceae bacterium]|jgi:acyl-CoA thioesterase FadM|nr:thioesterase family protein [Oceanospirillaceae bacterium]MBT4442758.1 thioesterase family protein [Oceanospirillaceae bacterium]MBT6078667.1 thioesterase family protein [Oceanospirillaceae bacterium]MBT7330751.1 thioesterase family protein [Oceanospirillaceae bacterium]
MTALTKDTPVHLYNCGMQVRVSDLNYGNHLGNDAILSYFHEIRVQWLSHNQLSEQEVGGCGLIMTGAHIDYLQQGHLHQKLTLSLSVNNISKARFSLVYKLKDQKSGDPIATGETHMGCFDYQRQKPARMPQGLLDILC